MKDETNTHLDFSIYEKRTSGHKKMVQYFKRLAEEDSVFIKKITIFRQKHNIPKNGLKLPPDEDFTTPYAPTIDFLNDEIELAKEYGIRDPFRIYLRNFILHNDLKSEWYYEYAEIIDLKETLDKHYLPNTADIRLQQLRESSLSHPIAILIDPYSRERDVLNLIAVTYKKLIEPLQQKYASKDIGINNVRRKSLRVKKRNNFIYKNRNKPIKTLVSMVNNEFGDTMDYTYVRKIIKEQVQKRNVNK